MLGELARIGCGVSRFQRVRVDGIGTPDPTCLQWPVRWPRLVARARADVATIMQQLKLYRLDNGFYPSTDQGLQALLVKPTTNPQPMNWKQGGYLERLPTDPWKRPYQYLNPGVRGEIDVFSLGADGQKDGDGVNADIGSWGL